MKLEWQKLLKTNSQVADRIIELATTRHGIRKENLIFDVLTFTLGSGDEEYWDAGINTIEAIRALRKKHPEVSTTLRSFKHLFWTRQRCTPIPELYVFTPLFRSWTNIGYHKC